MIKPYRTHFTRAPTIHTRPKSYHLRYHISKVPIVTNIERSSLRSIRTNLSANLTISSSIFCKSHITLTHPRGRSLIKEHIINSNINQRLDLVNTTITIRVFNSRVLRKSNNKLRLTIRNSSKTRCIQIPQSRLNNAHTALQRPTSHPVPHLPKRKRVHFSPP